MCIRKYLGFTCTEGRELRRIQTGIAVQDLSKYGEDAIYSPFHHFVLADIEIHNALTADEGVRKIRMK